MHMLPNKPMSTELLPPRLKHAGELGDTSIGGRLSSQQ